MTTFQGTLTATDGSGQTAAATVTITQTTPPLSATAVASPPSGPPGTVYHLTGTATGGMAPYTWTASPINGVQPQPVAGQPGVFTVTI